MQKDRARDVFAGFSFVNRELHTCLTISATSFNVTNVRVVVLYSRRSEYFLMIMGFWAFAITNENPRLHVRGFLLFAVFRSPRRHRPPGMPRWI